MLFIDLNISPRTHGLTLYDLSFNVAANYFEKKNKKTEKHEKLMHKRHEIIKRQIKKIYVCRRNWQSKARNKTNRLSLFIAHLIELDKTNKTFFNKYMLIFPLST